MDPDAGDEEVNGAYVKNAELYKHRGKERE